LHKALTPPVPWWKRLEHFLGCLGAGVGTLARSPWRWVALGVLSLLILAGAGLAAWSLRPPAYDRSGGEIFWADDHLLWASGDWLMAVPSSGSEPPYLVVKREGRRHTSRRPGCGGTIMAWSGRRRPGLSARR